MERLQPTQGEARFANLVQRGKVTAEWGVGNYVPIQGKSDAQFLDEAVGAIQDAGIITAHNPPGSDVTGHPRPERELLRPQFTAQLAAKLPVFTRHIDAV